MSNYRSYKSNYAHHDTSPSFYDKYREVEKEWNYYEDRAQQDRSRRQAHQRELEQEKLLEETKEEDATLATYEQIEEAGLFNKPRHLYLGLLEHRMMFYNGDEALLTYGRSGSGKGRDVIQPNLAHIKNSIVCLDPKGENAKISWKHRERMQGERPIFINPWKIGGLPNHDINPFQYLIVLAILAGKEKGYLNCSRLLDECKKIISIIIVEPVNVGANKWVYDDAKNVLELLLAFLALTNPEKCTLGELWDISNSTIDEFEDLFNTMMVFEGDEGYIAKKAKKLLDGLIENENTKSFDIITNEISNALNLYKTGSTLRTATNRTSRDP
ncbi:MAG: type IV secretory system conjugative DNA transfer family protein, partial [Bacteroidetes bacterium]|nr:type IV secretory system conjugative DNA transfer family protein [Bacteroidota bacterium]